MDYVLHPKSEIDDRIKRLQSQMNDMDGALLFDSVDMGYFSGTAQDGPVYIPKEGEPVVMMRKCLEVRSFKNMRTLGSDLKIPSSLQRTERRG